MTQPLHPYCPKCGWRKGGLDSWNGYACKCGLTANPIKRIEEPERGNDDQDPRAHLPAG